MLGNYARNMKFVETLARLCERGSSASTPSVDFCWVEILTMLKHDIDRSVFTTSTLDSI